MTAFTTFKLPYFYGKPGTIYVWTNTLAPDAYPTHLTSSNSPAQLC